MNDQPPPLPPASETPGDPTVEPAVRGPRGAGWVAAAVIAVSVAVAMVRVVEDKAGAPEAGGAGTTARLEAEVGARYLVGMNALLGRAVESAGHSKTTWLAPFEAAARTPRQKLELEIVRREMMGAGATMETGPVPAAATAEERRDWETWKSIRTANGSQAGTAALPDDDRKLFEERLGWFARLALSQGRADDDPMRAAVLGQAKRTFVGSLVLMTGIFGALALGCVLGAWALVQFRGKRAYWSFTTVDRPVVFATGGSVWLETFAVYLAVMVLGGEVADRFPAEWVPWPQAAAFLGAVVLGGMWPWFRGLTRSARRAGFGWHGGRGVWREAGAGVVGYVAGLPIVALGVGLTMVLTLWTKADASHPLNHLTGVPSPVLVFLGFLAAVWAPLVEELFFRGAFHAAWRQKCGRWISCLGTGVIFAAVHPQGWTAIPALGAVGLVLALLREWRSSVVAPITAHALNNGTLFAMMLVVLR